MTQTTNLNKQIIDFNNSIEFHDLTAYYSQSSIFSALGVSRHENTHSNFLAWLLTPNSEKNNHGLGDIPLRKLFSTLALVCSSLPHALGKIPPDIISALISDEYTLSNITVEREKYIGAGRLDICLEGCIEIDNIEYPLRLIIENKIASDEFDTQTERYQTALNQSVSRPGLYLSIYLTPLINRVYECLKTSQCASKEFIQLNYQYLADYVILPCRNSTPEGSIRRYLDEYLLALGLPELRSEKGDIIMAISKEERDLLSRFWNKHKDLLIATMLAIGDSDAIDDTEREIVQKASQALKKAAQRDTSRYTWSFLGKKGNSLPKGRLVLEVVTHYALHSAPISLKELKAAFPDNLQPGRLCVVTTLADADVSNFKGRSRYYTDEPIELSDCLAAVSNQWRLDNLDGFIVAARKLGYSINSTD